MQQDRFFIGGETDKLPYECWCRLIRDRRWSSSQKRDLIHYFKSPSRVLDAPVEQVRMLITGRQRSLSSSIDEFSVQADLSWLNRDNHHLIPFTDERYPPLLLELTDPPLALFAIGNIGLLTEPQVAIVGSRRPTPVGEKITRTISHDLAELEVVVTSGMAFGVDGAAHQAAITNGGKSIAVLGNGLDTIYPSRHRALYEDLAAGGLLISEYPLGVKPSRYTFPQRNRIISGLSFGVVIVEAAERSGTLITARLAMEQNREVMVVPGSALSTQYYGSHQLLKQGAALVSSAKDVIHCLSEPLSRFVQANTSLTSTSLSIASNTDAKHFLLKYISTESTSIDDIILGSELTSAEVSSMLLELELLGVVAIADDGGYVNLS